MKKYLIISLKVSISVAIIGYLIWEAQRGTTFTDLCHQPKHWGMFVVAAFLCAAAVLTTFVRWHYLVRALHIPSRMTHSLRIGFLGYMFNLVPLGGIIGGDAIKAVMLAREHKNSQAKSIASVVVDRVIGLYMLFVVASIAIWITGFGKSSDPVIASCCSAAYWVTAIGALGFAALMWPAISDGKLVRKIESAPRIGPPIKNLTDAMRMYRRRPVVLLVAAVMSMGVHSLFAAGIFFIACGLPSTVHHSLSTHFVLSPLSFSTGAIPLALGPFEFVLNLLYHHANPAIPQGQGLVVALGYRLITILIATIGVCYYLSARQEVARSIREAEDDHSSTSGSSMALSEKCSSASAA